jgi:hypothetical protein
MEFGLAMKASKKRSIKETAETPKTLKNKQQKNYKPKK